MSKTLKANPAWGTSLLYEADGVTLRSDSYDSLRQRVQCAIDAGIKKPDTCCGCYAYIMDLYPTMVVYSMDGNLYQVDYTDDGEAATLGGDPVEVEASYSVVSDANGAEESAGEAPTRALLGTVVQLNEAAYDTSKGELTLTVIKPGFSLNQSGGRQRYYPAATLKRDHKIFEGGKMFADHQTDKEVKERPEGSVNNWVAQITKTWAEADGTVKATAQVIDPPFKAKLDRLNDKSLLNQMGISVRIGAEVSEAEIEGKEAMSIDSIVSSRSTDFVTYAGAGGQVEMMESAADTENDLELASEAQLRKKRPDLVELIESKSKGREAHEMAKTLEAQLLEAQTVATAEKARADAADAKAKNLQETSDGQVQQIATLTEKITASEVAAKKVAAAAELKTLLEASLLAKLPASVRTMAYSRVSDRFKEAETTDGMKEAISAEEAYVKSMNGPAKVTRMGGQDNIITSERKSNLKEGFLGMGMTEKEAEVAAAGRR